MEYQTPGVYIAEQNAFPGSVAQVATAVPVFIGYTAKARPGGEDFANKPTRVTSLLEYEKHFGAGPVPVFDLREAGAAAWGTELAVPPLLLQLTDLTGSTSAPAGLKAYALAPEKGSVIYYLHNCLRLFYQNGGGVCYIISIGEYAGGGNGNPAAGKPRWEDFTTAIDLLIDEAEPTLLVCPDALCLGEDDYYRVVRKMLEHCGATRSRMAVLDVYQGAVTDPLNPSGEGSPVARFRAGISTNHLMYGACYFPWMHATAVSDAETSFQNMSQGLFAALVAGAAPAVKTPAAKGLRAQPRSLAELATAKQRLPAALTAYAKLLQEAQRLHTPSQSPDAATEPAAQARTAEETRLEVLRLHQALLAASPDYARIAEGITRYRNTLPVAAAMAGVYTAVDASRGVWKAPASVALSGVTAPTIPLRDSDQAQLNVDAVAGKSINAIRAFTGKGVLVWGARTLDGNSSEWRYVNVRRTMNMVEQSIRLATRAYVFEPNDANTWTAVQSMINNFLVGLWRQGAFVGNKPEQAFHVAVGLGRTMTAQDILDGYLNIDVLVALLRPAEFITLRLQLPMQKA